MDDDDWLLSLSDDKFISDERILSARLLATQELTSTGTDDRAPPTAGGCGKPPSSTCASGRRSVICR